MREERWLKAKVLLDRLQYMPWTQYRKTQVINRGIFPLIFYGCNTWRAGKDFLREVRAKCNHSVWGKKQYHLHYLSPLFSGQQYEPSLYVARHRFSALLRLFARHEALVRQVWDQSILAKSYFKGKSRGCISLFQSQLNDLGWAMYPGGRCITHQGWEFSIWQVSTAQFLQVVQQAWEHSLLQHLQLKHNLEDLCSFSAAFSQSPAHPACKFCGQEDTLKHRVYECVGTEHIRQLPQWDEVAALPYSQVLGGLSGLPEELESFHKALDNIQHPDVQPLPDLEGHRFFFTDGSAFDPGNPQALLCSWAVTEAEESSKNNTLRSSGLLPGRKQSVFRAELHAANVAIAMSRKAVIYVDNEATMRRVRQILSGTLYDTELIQHPDRDLLQTTISLLKSRAPGDVHIYWTKSHRSLYDATGSRDLWCIYHNAKADSHAKAAGKLAPLPVLQAQQNLLCKLKQMMEVRANAAVLLRQVMDEFL
ncbi:unnamed protein product [Symbiodinium sp. CCMP2592]|nr:unnamed protein product [Symbiodinium sp. CCMP2592]